MGGKVSEYLKKSQTFETVRSALDSCEPLLQYLRAHLLNRRFEVVSGDTSPLASGNALVVIVTILRLVKGVGHDGGDGEMSLVVLSSAAVAIFEESDAVLEEGEFPAVHCRYEASVVF